MALKTANPAKGAAAHCAREPSPTAAQCALQKQRPATTMTLNYLDFDYSEDDEGTGTFDAMASVAEHHWGRLQGEVIRVLNWCMEQFPEGPAPVEEGGNWQYDLQGTQEVSTPLTLHFDPAAGTVERHSATPGTPRLTLTLSLSGSPQFCEAFRSAFGEE